MTEKLENPFGRNHHSTWTRSQLENALVYAVTALDVIGETLNDSFKKASEENDWANHVGRQFEQSIVHFPVPRENLMKAAWDARESANGTINWLEDPEHFSN
jgi:hypothetical protein